MTRAAILLTRFTLIFSAMVVTASAIDRTQTIELKKGWNAVYLEVEPGASDPDKVFAGSPIDMVATYFASKTSSQFVTDPGVDLFKSLGWATWYAGDRPDAFLTTLDAIYGRRAYLVHAKSDYQWAVTGTVLVEEQVWQADSFNLVGFPVAAVGAPTYAQFFAGSQAHSHNKIYRLVGGSWKRIIDPSAESMKSGEAFWIYCDGNSGYRGPLSVETRFRKGLLLIDGGRDEVIFRNQCDHPIAVTVDHETTTADAVPLSVVFKVVGDPSKPVRSVAVGKPASAWSQVLPVLEAGESISLPFEVRASEMTKAAYGSLLKITTDLGTECWVPVAGFRRDLEQKNK